MKRYFLPPWVHWRLVNERCIILDIENDCYLQVPTEQFLSILPFVESGDEMPMELAEFADELLAAHVLTHISPHTARLSSPSLPRPTTLVSTGSRTKPMKEILRALPYFLLACAKADYSLRCTSLSGMSARVSDRKSRFAQATTADSLEREVELTHTYHSLRPFYPRDYLCLFDSLALMEFLAHWNIFPNWVFGVTVDPFKAHCWVQEGAVVLSDTISFSSRWFSPIMVL